MIFSIILFVLSWICFALFADKKRFFQIAPTCYIAMYLSAMADFFVRDYPLWVYPAPSHMLEVLRTLLHSLSAYSVVTYLFLQTLPKVQTTFKVIRHIFYWSLPALLIEIIAIKTGNMKHGLWWDTKCSYVSDWILFALFYIHHKWKEEHTGRNENDGFI